jgi:hypothetical protein
MVTSIKQKLHDLIDQIDNESILNQIYALINLKNSSKGDRLWNNLTPEEQSEVLLSLKESQDQNNLISNDEVKKQHRKWL